MSKIKVLVQLVFLLAVFLDLQRATSPCVFTGSFFCVLIRAPVIRDWGPPA